MNTIFELVVLQYGFWEYKVCFCLASFVFLLWPNTSYHMVIESSNHVQSRKTVHTYCREIEERLKRGMLMLHNWVEFNTSMWGRCKHLRKIKKIINKITRGLKWEKKDWRVYYFLLDKINWQVPINGKVFSKYYTINFTILFKSALIFYLFLNWQYNI